MLYAQRYGWDERFEALAAQIVANFVNQYNPVGECCWIAEIDGDIVGRGLVVQANEQEEQHRYGHDRVGETRELVR